MNLYFRTFVLNLLIVWGVTGLIRPFGLSDETIGTDYMWLLGITGALLPLLYFGRRLARLDGLILLVFFAAYYWRVMLRD